MPLIFGEKDYQQLYLIKKMVQQYFLDINIRAVQTVRDASGLPLSSRNQRLLATDLDKAKTFFNVFRAYQVGGEHSLLEALEQLGLQLDYFEVHEGRAFIAVNINGIRLIDNILLRG